CRVDLSRCRVLTVTLYIRSSLSHQVSIGIQLKIAGAREELSLCVIHNEESGTLNRNVQRIIRRFQAALSEVGTNGTDLCSQTDAGGIAGYRRARSCELLAQNITE